MVSVCHVKQRCAEIGIIFLNSITQKIKISLPLQVTNLRTNQEGGIACRNESHLVSGLWLVSKRQVDPVEQLRWLVDGGIQRRKGRHVSILRPRSTDEIVCSARWSDLPIQWRRGPERYKYTSATLTVCFCYTHRLRKMTDFFSFYSSYQEREKEKGFLPYCR